MTNLDIAMRLRHFTDAEMGARVGLSHTAVNHKRRGKSRITPAEMVTFADELRVPARALDSTAGDLLRWFAQEADGEQMVLDLEMYETVCA